MRTLLAAAAILAALLPIEAQARLTETAKVRYETSDGRSKWYSVDVNFLTGTELNRATASFRYNGFKNYAVIFWGDEQVSVILLNSPILFCALEFTSNCLPILGRMKGPDQEGRQWEVCTAMFC